ncbi:peptide/nickel transport system substrate-binding protein [Crossiella equi]|uniref:Peptide/nickel transport system substrate-binding protein n=1 Tax=Crossiella equi TaxID=130796 RepID=A0ABS5AGC3_9PSEU|nr:ABC transporter substrate-binding protein [Crossiella equi]MBP2475322.1 peptide/nickel transport system substrate-binding protein [Crossiella equi]
MAKIYTARGSTLRKLAVVGTAGVTAFSLAACAQSQRDGNQGAGKTGGTFTFAAAGAPKLFDPFYATDGETFRISRQVFEGLVGFKPETAEATGELAENWTQTPDGKTWTFNLRKGVKFHDDTPFNAEAVCYNFNRWYGQTGAGQSAAVSQYWTDNFGGFSDGKEPSLFKSCTAKDENTAVVEITRSTSTFPDVLGLPSFSMQSPTAMQKYNANDVKQAGDSFTFPAYANEHPTGTGPFKFEKFDRQNNVIELSRFDGYWGEKTKLDKLNFKVVRDESTRKQDLKTGAIDGYDLPVPQDWPDLKKDFSLLQRQPFNIFYLGVTQKSNPKLQDLRVRQALAHAINREQLVKSQLPEGASVATQFMPKTVSGYADDVVKYDYNPDKAKQLLAAAGAADLTLNFWWPSEVSRPYMPKPQDLYGAIKADLEKVGIKINTTTKPWAAYLEDVDQQAADIFLLGWTGDFNTPHNWIGTFFGNPENRFWTAGSPWGKQLAADLKTADTEPDKAKREALYKELNRKIMSEYLPGVPISHSPPALVVTKSIHGVRPSPLTAEEFGPVTKG